MTEVAESHQLLANILRTLPYTAYTATFVVGALFPSSGALPLFFALAVNEALNHLLKFALRALGKPGGPLDGPTFRAAIARPPGAKDCGIYPQHAPKVSTSSGMPSGHAQTACFLADVLLRRAGEVGEVTLFARAMVVGTACLVLLHRTQWGGKYVSVCVGGRVTGCHTVPQVLVGGAIGLAVARAAYPFTF
jgi:hypothetical protein